MLEKRTGCTSFLAMTMMMVLVGCNSSPINCPHRLSSSFLPRMSSTVNRTTLQADLTGSGGIVAAKVYAIGINNPLETYYGNPGKFWTAFNESALIHDLDQYVGSSLRDRYPYAGGSEVDGIDTTQSIDSIVEKILSAHVQDGYGENALYNIFTPSGMNIGSGCAWHSAKDISVGGQSYSFVYAVYSYPGSGCGVGGGEVNGLVPDTEANMMSHEMSEAITDPMTGGIKGWNAPNGEIGDICGNPKQVYTLVDGSKYKMQGEWSNITHSCVFDDGHGTGTGDDQTSGGLGPVTFPGTPAPSSSTPPAPAPSGPPAPIPSMGGGSGLPFC